MCLCLIWIISKCLKDPRWTYFYFLFQLDCILHNTFTSLVYLHFHERFHLWKQVHSDFLCVSVWHSTIHSYVPTHSYSFLSTYTFLIKRFYLLFLKYIAQHIHQDTTSSLEDKFMNWLQVTILREYSFVLHGDLKERYANSCGGCMRVFSEIFLCVGTYCTVVCTGFSSCLLADTQKF